MKRTRKSWSYKIKMWFYRLTFEDVKKTTNIICSFAFEFVITLLGFILLFLIPALFH